MNATERGDNCHAGGIVFESMSNGFLKGRPVQLLGSAIRMLSKHDDHESNLRRVMHYSSLHICIYYETFFVFLEARPGNENFSFFFASQRWKIISRQSQHILGMWLTISSGDEADGLQSTAIKPNSIYLNRLDIDCNTICAISDVYTPVFFLFAKGLWNHCNRKFMNSIFTLLVYFYKEEAGTA